MHKPVLWYKHVSRKLLNNGSWVLQGLPQEKTFQVGEKLSGIIYERGVNEKEFTIIRSKADAALFGGFSTNDMKRKPAVPAFNKNIYN